MNNNELDFFQKKTDFLLKEKAINLKSLEIAATLSNYTKSLNQLQEPSLIFKETENKIKNLIPLNSVCFLLTNEENSDFEIHYVKPGHLKKFYVTLIDELIDNRIFSLALRKTSPHFYNYGQNHKTIMIHAIATPSRIRGMFCCVMDRPKNEILDISYSLVTISLLSCANALESMELYHQINKKNILLKEKFEQLKESETKLIKQRSNLEKIVEERTKSLENFNQILQKEIIERRKAEVQLKRESNYISAILNTVDALILVINQEGAIINVNKAFEYTTGYSQHEVLNRKIWNILFAKDDELTIKNTFLSAFKEKKTNSIITNIFRKDGKKRVISWSNALLKDEEKTYSIIGTGIDITKQYEAQSSLRKTFATYINIFNNAIEGIFKTSPEGKFETVNPAMAKMLGYNTAEELIESITNIQKQLYVNPKKRKQLITLLEKYGEVKNFEFQVYRKDKRKIWVSINAKAFVGKNSKIENIEGLAQEITMKKLSEIELQKRATLDSLTQIPNRYLFQKSFEQMIAQGQRRNIGIALLFIDLDLFKNINDQFGHQIGDQLLIQVAERLKKRLRKSDLAARIGGDEFTVLLYNIDTPESAERVAEEVHSIITSPYIIENNEMTIGASIGISIYPLSGASCEELIKKADSAMYYAKQHGKNTYRIYQTDQS